MLEAINNLADLLVQKAPQFLRTAFNEEDRSTAFQPEAAHFLKFKLNDDERRMGRDFEVYNFMSSVISEGVVTTHLLEELVLPLQGYSPEAFKAGMDFLRGRVSVFDSDKQQQWLDLLTELEK